MTAGRSAWRTRVLTLLAATASFAGAIAAPTVVPAVAPTVAQADVYRCGPDGRDYSSVPCPEGRRVEVADPRTPAERDAARKVAQDEARRADALVRERAAREAARRPTPGARKAAASGSRPSDPAVPRKPKKTKPPRADPTPTADPAAPARVPKPADAVGADNKTARPTKAERPAAARHARPGKPPAAQP